MLHHKTENISHAEISEYPEILMFAQFGKSQGFRLQLTKSTGQGQVQMYGQYHELPWKRNAELTDDGENKIKCNNVYRNVLNEVQTDLVLL